MAETVEEQKARLQALWRRLDSKKQGALDLQGLQTGLQQMQHPLKDADGLVRDMLATCDVDADGRITYPEFVSFCTEAERRLLTLFRTIDRDDNGKLDKAELAVAFEKAGVVVSNARLDRFFAYIDKDHDGRIDFAEWRDFLLFMPTHSAGLRSVLSYYNSTVKITADGDVHLSDEALSGLGTKFDFLKASLFGAITQILPPTSPSPISTTLPRDPDPDPDPDLATTSASTTATKSWSTSHEADTTLAMPTDSHLAPRPACVTEDASPTAAQVQIPAREPVTLTDFVPHLGYFVAGGVAGIVSRTATAPLDRLKTYLIAQTGDASATAAVEAARSGAPLKATKHGASTLWLACKELWAAGGMRSLFAGNGLNIVKVLPESGVKFGSYEAAKRAVAKFEGHNDPKNIAPMSQFTAGGLAGMVSQAVVYPVDTLKFRLQCETVPNGLAGNALIRATAAQMWRTSGVTAFYRGLPMGLVGMFPYAAIDLYIFETLKKSLTARNMARGHYKHEEDALPGNFALALIGAFSGAVGASVVYPINLVRTRLQSQGTALHPRVYTGITDVARQTVRGEGWRGLYKGLLPNLLKVVPTVSITYVIYENTKKALHLQ